MVRSIGIDLGTYNSAAAVAVGRSRVAMIESRYGRTLYGKSFPSFVLFDHNGNRQLVASAPARSCCSTRSSWSGA
jgi:molecular chaperone DnaK (HSP70)